MIQIRLLILNQKNLQNTPVPPNFRQQSRSVPAFKLPPGFEITLYASEPDISKPMNMEFDERGRLRAKTVIGLMNLTYNLFRKVQIA